MKMHTENYQKKSTGLTKSMPRAKTENNNQEDEEISLLKTEAYFKQSSQKKNPDQIHIHYNISSLAEMTLKPKQLPTGTKLGNISHVIYVKN